MRYDIENIMDQYPPLAESEERRLIEDNKNDRRRLNELLVLHNVALVVKIVNKDIHGFENYRDDLISSGVESLHKAAESFKPLNGIKFSSYAFVCVRRGILRFIEQNLSKYVKHSNYHLDQRISFGGGTQNRGDATVEGLVYDLIDPCWRHIPGTRTVVEEDDFREFGKSVINEINAMDNISKRDRKVLIDYLYSETGRKKKTFEAIGKRYGFSKEWAHQIITKNIPKVRRMMKRKFDIFNLSQVYG